MIKKYTFLLMLLTCVAAGLFSSCTQERQPCIQPTIVTLRFGTYKYLVNQFKDPLDTAVIDSSVLQLIDSVLPQPYVGPIRADTGIQLFLYDSISGQGNKFAVILSNHSDTCMYRINASTVIDLPPFINSVDNDSTHKFDTLTFIYTRKLSFLSNACGYTYFYNINSVKSTHYNIDSVIIENGSVTSDVNVEHVQVIFKGYDYTSTIL